VCGRTRIGAPVPICETDLSVWARFQTWHVATLHGARVKGYNNSLRANGERRSVIHGLWSGPQSAARYMRLDMASEIVPMANNVLVMRYQNGSRGPESEAESEPPPESDDEGVRTDSDGEVPERPIRPRRNVRPHDGR
jgi:hypothetical protein